MISPQSAISPERAVAPAIHTVVLLPEVNTYVSPATPGKSFAGQNLAVSADQNQAGNLAYVRFDLAPIPPDAVVTACQLYFTIAGPVTPQVVKLLLVDNNTWAESVTLATAPKPTDVGIGTWRVQSDQRVTTPPDDPALVAQVQKQLAATIRKLSFQIRSTFGQEGAPTENSYYSFENAAAEGKYASAPRLVVQYIVPAKPLSRNWGQGQADARHSGRSQWIFANTPTTSYLAETVVGGVQLSSPPIIRDQLLYLFTPTSLQVLDPAGGTLSLLVSGLAQFVTLALDPNGLLYAAAKVTGEIAGFDLTAGGKKTISLPLANLTSDITAGADGSVYLAQGSLLLAYVQRLGTLSPAWSRQMAIEVTSPVTLSADGSVAYVATATRLYALYTADGSEKWSFALPTQAKHLTTPVAGAANGLSYFGVDEKLYIFRDIGSPVSDNLGLKGPISQPVIDAHDILYVLQGPEIYTVSRDGTTKPSSVLNANIMATDPVKPVMDGAGNLFIIDNQCKFFVYTPELKAGNTPQSLPFAFGGSQPSLQVAPNGSLYCHSGSTLFRLTPAVGGTVEVSSFADSTAYRAASSLSLSGAALPAAASVIFQSGGSISIEPGFSVPVATEAVFNTGF